MTHIREASVNLENDLKNHMRLAFDEQSVINDAKYERKITDLIGQCQDIMVKQKNF